MKSSKGRNGLCSSSGGKKEENHEVVWRGGGDKKEKEVEDQIAPLLITTKTHMGPLTNEKKKKRARRALRKMCGTKSLPQETGDVYKFLIFYLKYLSFGK